MRNTVVVRISFVSSTFFVVICAMSLVLLCFLIAFFLIRFYLHIMAKGHTQNVCSGSRRTSYMT